MPNGGEDICVQGVYNRNRALHGDRVVIDILPENDWKVLQEKFRDFVMLQQIEIKIDEEEENNPSGHPSTKSINENDTAEDVENKPDLDNVNNVVDADRAAIGNASDLAEGIEKININKEACNFENPPG